MLKNQFESAAILNNIKAAVKLQSSGTNEDICHISYIKNDPWILSVKFPLYPLFSKSWNEI